MACRFNAKREKVRRAMCIWDCERVRLTGPDSVVAPVCRGSGTARTPGSTA
jgi:hypothetical protein